MFKSAVSYTARSTFCEPITTRSFLFSCICLSFFVTGTPYIVRWIILKPLPRYLSISCLHCSANPTWNAPPQFFEIFSTLFASDGSSAPQIIIFFAPNARATSAQWLVTRKSLAILCPYRKTTISCTF